ncbi:hypothetical protein DdX_16332 [Ditylenchus destructor]|uniref:Uncharacterized protein n=1 Tax=Ditylenchus destructor TaxID=166010 RepID=A0AAD4MR77_9BILA|nr:hypothetical protein DdX_16332 [Ditylenchus destructor]
MPSGPPNLVTCIHCDRLFSRRTISVHQDKRCLANPKVLSAKISELNLANDANLTREKKRKSFCQRRNSASISRHSNGHDAYAVCFDKNTGTGRERSKTAKERGKKMSRSLSSAIKNKEEFPRPSTSTVNINGELQDMGKEGIENRDQSQNEFVRVCYVCGNRYFVHPIHGIENSITDDHQSLCETSWRRTRASLPHHIHTWSPRVCPIPSVDGTVNLYRVEQFAKESSRKAQQARCTRCLQTFSFTEAKMHKCPKFEPTVQFYY